MLDLAIAVFTTDSMFSLWSSAATEGNTPPNLQKYLLINGYFPYITLILDCEDRQSPSNFPDVSITAAPVSSQLVSMPRTLANLRWQK